MTLPEAIECGKKAAAVCRATARQIPDQEARREWIRWSKAIERLIAEAESQTLVPPEALAIMRDGM